MFSVRRERAYNEVGGDGLALFGRDGCVGLCWHGSTIAKHNIHAEVFDASSRVLAELFGVRLVENVGVGLDDGDLGFGIIMPQLSREFCEECGVSDRKP